MTREELQEEIQDKKDFIKVCNETSGNFLEWTKEAEKELTYLEKQLAELEVEVYMPIYLSQSGHNYAITKNGKSGSAFEKYLERHNAGEEFKQRLSKLNNGWFPDWNDKNQVKCFLKYNVSTRTINAESKAVWRFVNDHECFNPKLIKVILKDEEMLILWKIWKGIK